MHSPARIHVSLWKRPFLALAIATGILGTVWAYERFQASVRPAVALPAEQATSAIYDLEITLTFTAVADAFALDDAHSLLLSFRGQPLLKRAEPVEAGQPLEIQEIPGVVVGRNEFYLEVFPADESALREHAVRLRILQAGNVVAEQTLWSPAGEPVRGVIRLDVPANSSAELGEEDAADHDIHTL